MQARFYRHVLQRRIDSSLDIYKAGDALAKLGPMVNRGGGGALHIFGQTGLICRYRASVQLRAKAAYNKIDGPVYPWDRRRWPDQHVYSAGKIKFHIKQLIALAISQTMKALKHANIHKAKANRSASSLI
jgi:hypothetical protein